MLGSYAWLKGWSVTISAVTLDELASEGLVHRYGDLFAPPGLSNFVGTVAVDNDLVSVRNPIFPPFGQGDSITARTYVGGRLVGAYGAPVTFSWRPDRVVRTASLGDIDVTTTTVLVPDVMALVLRVELRDRSGSARQVPVHLGFASAVTHALRPWNDAVPPGESGHAVASDEERNAVRFTATGSTAVCLQGVDRPARVSGHGVDLTADLGAGRTWTVGVVVAVGPDRATAERVFDLVVTDTATVVQSTAERWQEELDAMFTRGNARFGGSLPVLETSNAALRRLYYLGALGVLYFRRDSAYSVMGRTYDTLMPRYWASVTFIWDYYLSCRVHALLDPGVMRRYLEYWIVTDTHTHFGTEWLTGSPTGYWYSVNDLAMTRMIREYVAWSGDEEWLLERVEGDPSGRIVAEHLERFATAYQELLQPHGIADYGGIDNLLECVSSYVHGVAALNAGNVWCLRTAAEMQELLGDDDRSAELRRLATERAAAVNGLYVRGGGHWATRHPDGSQTPVKHCYDFFQVPFAMLDDLDQQQRDEMVDFFVRELQTPTWMHALSPEDPDAIFSVRPDHQWNGAYPAWPAESAAALFRMGRDDVAATWLEGLAASSNQGPFGQAHFAETAVRTEGAGARKAPPEQPWINDWTCSSNGAWVGLVIDAIFGVSVGLDGTVVATPRLDLLDPQARLRGLVVRGQSYDIDGSGAHPVTQR